MAPPPESLVVETGRILAARFVDVADEIHLDRAERALSGAPGLGRVRLRREGSEAFEFPVRPLSITLGPRALPVRTLGRDAEVDVSARIYSYGAVSVLCELPIARGTSLANLVPLCDELYDTPAVERLARDAAREVTGRIADAVQAPHEWHDAETYTIVFVEALRGSPNAREVLAAPELAHLLLGEPTGRTLSAEQRADVLGHASSYLEDDLVVIDWNSAFVLEPSGNRDVADVLEFATSQLLELRYYDALLDRELDRIYEEFSGARRMFGRRYASLARDVQRTILELAECTERIENAVKIIGDFYLARVYRNAIDRFQMRSWEDSVARKQKLVAQVYALLKDEFDIRRSTMLETAIVVLIVLEIVLAFWID